MTWLAIFLWTLAGLVGLALVAALAAFWLCLYFILRVADDNPDDNQLAAYGDGAWWPRQTGTYEPGVQLSHPEPADQVLDDDDPTKRPEWPGKVKRRAF